MPGHELAQAWGYVVAAYFLMEEAFKAVLHGYGSTRWISNHVLHTLFTELSGEIDHSQREPGRPATALLGTCSQGPPFPFGELDPALDSSARAAWRRRDHRGTRSLAPYCPIEASSNDLATTTAVVGRPRRDSAGELVLITWISPVEQTFPAVAERSASCSASSTSADEEAGRQPPVWPLRAGRPRRSGPCRPRDYVLATGSRARQHRLPRPGRAPRPRASSREQVEVRYTTNTVEHTVQA